MSKYSYAVTYEEYLGYPYYGNCPTCNCHNKPKLVLKIIILDYVCTNITNFELFKHTIVSINFLGEIKDEE